MHSTSFEDHARSDPFAIAVIDSNRREWRRHEVGRLIDKAVCIFSSLGLQAGDVLIIVAPNCAEYLAIYLASLQAGLRVVPVNWHLSLSEIAFIIEDSGAKAIVTHERIGTRILAFLRTQREAGRALLSIGAVEGFVVIDDFVPDPHYSRGRSSLQGRLMAYTSATTGRPKGVVLPLHSSRAATARTIAWHMSLGIAPCDDNVHLCSSMLYHAAPLEGAVIALHMGHKVVLVDQWHAETLLQLIETYSVTTAFMVPTMFVRLLKLPRETRRQYRSSSLRFVIHAGAPCPIDVKRQMIDWWGPIIWESYGATEGQGTIVNSEAWLKYPGTVGKPILGSQIRILDENGKDLPSGTIGLIYLKSYTGDRFEYKGNPEATKQSYRGEYFCVGDLGFVNQDGYLFVSERQYDVIISSGANIYPAEIEQVLVQHPDIVDCAVIGMPDELFGEIPKAIVQLRSGTLPNQQVTCSLLSFLSQQLAPAKLPKAFLYVDELPRDPAGKLFRRRLRIVEQNSGTDN